MDAVALRVTRWLLEEAARLERPEDVVRGLSEELVGAGFPLDRLWYGTILLHPQMYARSWTWKRGDPDLDPGVLTHAMARTQVHLGSPAFAVMGATEVLRFRLDRVGALEYPLLERMRGLGLSEYVAFSLRTRSQPFAALSICTARPGGFSDADVATVLALRPALALLLRAFLDTELSDVLLRTYLGRDAGERVRRGQIQRGDGETIPAALWFSDLRDFTGLSERLPRDALLDLLNDWFEATVEAVEKHQGTVLKFMGDGMLAVFTASEDEPSRRAACQRALAAASSAAERVARANEKRREDGRAAIRYGMALHIGDVMYGNIGSPERLDFTVIGPAVNRAARLEPLCGRLGRTVVVSGDFARTAGGDFVPLGAFELKGLSERIEVFGLPGDDQRP